MSWAERRAGGDRESGGNREGSPSPSAREEMTSAESQQRREFDEIAGELLAAVDEVTLEEVRQIDTTLESDAQRGRELLYLLTHAEWCRRTTEVIDIGQIGTLETTVVIDVDLGQIEHETLDTSGPEQWLPLLVLPRDGDRDRDRADDDGERVPDPGVRVFDAGGLAVFELPQTETRRQIAGALAGILIDLLADEPRHRTGDTSRPGVSPRLSREHHVLLAAVIGQVLRRGGRATARGPREYLRNRARQELYDVLTQQRNALKAWQPPEERRHTPAEERSRWSVLSSHAAEILAIMRTTSLVVVPVSRSGVSQALTLRLPERHTVVRRPRRLQALLPGAGAQVHVRLTPGATSGHVTRVIRLDLPSGVDLLPSRDGQGVRAEFEVFLPRRFDLLNKLLGHLVDRRSTTGPWAVARLAELAYRQAQAAEEALRNHYLALDSDGADRTAATAKQLRELRTRTRKLSDAPDGAREWEEVRESAGPTRSWMPYRVLRRHSVTSRPDSAEVHLPPVEEFTLLAAPRRASIEVDLGVSETETLATARAINTTNVAVLVGVTLLLFLAGKFKEQPGSMAEVLATLLTIFPTIQASRIPRLNPSRLIGLLSATHFRWGLATVLPSLSLAGILAVWPAGPGTVWTSAVLTVLQAAFFIPFRRLTSPLASRTGTGWAMVDEGAPDDHAIDSLYSTWARDLTGEALLVGRAPYTYLTTENDHPGGFSSLLRGYQGPAFRLRDVGRDVGKSLLQGRRTGLTTGEGLLGRPINLLGSLRVSHTGRALTLMMFRTQPVTSPGADHGSGGISLTPVTVSHGLALLEPPEWVLEILIGIPAADTGASDRHALLLELTAATASRNYAVLTLQQPATPPHPFSERAQTWTRVRVSIPYHSWDSLNGFVRLLETLEDLRRRTGGEVRVHEVPPMATTDAVQNAAEELDIFGAKVGVAPPDRGRLLREDELDAATADPDPDALAPLFLVIHGPVRVGFLGRALRSVAAQLQAPTLLAVEARNFHGLSVFFLVYRRPTLSPVQVDAHVRRLRDELDRIDHGSQVIVPEAPVARSGGAGLPRRRPHPAPMAPPIPKALLRVYVRTPDRPGIVQELLEELRRQVGQVIGRTGQEPDIRLSHTQTVDGRHLIGRFLVRLPLTPQLPVWAQDAHWSAAERALAQSLSPSPADRIGANGTFARITLVRTRDPARTVTLPDEVGVGAAGDHGGGGPAAPGTVDVTSPEAVAPPPPRTSREGSEDHG